MDHIQLEANLEISALIEALLFAAPSPITPSQIAEVLEVSVAVIERELQSLSTYYEEQQSSRGIRLQVHRGRVQLTTAPQAAEAIERLLGLEVETRLSHAALETLAIVMYKQPATRPQIDSIRGVNSDGVLRNLLSKGLIQEIGRSSSPGRPILYGTTSELLQYFGLNSLSELPEIDFESIEQQVTDLGTNSGSLEEEPKEE